MKRVRSAFQHWSVAFITLVFLPAWAYGMGIELEPTVPSEINHPCENAQVMTNDQGFCNQGVYGDLDSQDVDFYKFCHSPGEVVISLVGKTVPVEEWPDQYPLEDPYLGLFDANCNLIASNDNGGDGFNSQLTFRVPEDDWWFVLAASANPDYGFDGSHSYYGNYQIDVVGVPLEPNSVRGRVVDAFTGDPLPDAFVDLLNCWDWDSVCTLFDPVSSQVTDAQGEFLFESTASGAPLDPGFYKVSASAPDYQSGTSEVFELLEGEDLDIGDLALVGPPVRFSDVSPCEYVPAIGGKCEYSVRITNAQPERLKGAAWSLVIGSGTGSYLGDTEFQAGGLERLVLASGASAEVEFEFDVPGTVPQGTYICPDVWVGLGLSEPHFFTLGRMQPLFCIEKGIADSYTLITGAEAKAIVQQLKSQQNRKLPTRVSE